MVAIPHDCPHCSTKRASFTLLQEYRHPANKNEIHTFLQCGVCANAAVGVFTPANKSVPQNQLSFNGHYAANPHEFIEKAFYPKPSTPAAPDHMPDNVRVFFLEAVDNIKTGPNAAGSMLRKSIDVALKHVAPDAKGNLVSRIDKAAKLGKITSELAEWAHHIRLEGNDAAHDEDPFTVDEAKALHHFTELVLMYLFTLPGMLKAHKGGSDVAEEGAAPEEGATPT